MPLVFHPLQQAQLKTYSVIQLPEFLLFMGILDVFLLIFTKTPILNRNSGKMKERSSLEYYEKYISTD